MNVSFWIKNVAFLKDGRIIVFGSRSESPHDVDFVVPASLRDKTKEFLVNNKFTSATHVFYSSSTLRIFLYTPEWHDGHEGVIGDFEFKFESWPLS